MENNIDNNLDTIITERHYYFYLICLRTHIDSKNKVFKLGRTYSVHKRFFTDYPKNSILLYLCKVKDAYHVEWEMIKIFTKLFTRKLDLGNEYFKGNISDLIKCATYVINHMNQKIDVDDNFISIRNKYKHRLHFKLNNEDHIDDNDNEFIFNTVDDEDVKIPDPPNQKKITNQKIKKLNFREGIIGVDNIDSRQYEKYMDLYTNNKSLLSENELYSLERYLYMNYWNVDDIDEEFLDKWFRKTYVLYNLRQLKGVNDDEDLITIDLHTDKKYLNYEKAKQNQRIEYVKDLVVTMGFNFDNINKDSTISKDIFDENRKKCIKNCKIFTNSMKTESLFDVKINNIQSNRAFMGFINTLLQHYGVYIKSDRKSIRDQKTKRKTDSYFYYIDYILNIVNYI
jgi:hypothetical protein